MWNLEFNLGLSPKQTPYVKDLVLIDQETVSICDNIHVINQDETNKQTKSEQDLQEYPR